MTNPAHNDLSDLARAAGETSLGAAILVVRRLNIFRREDNPAADLVDAGLDALGNAIPEASSGVANVMMVASALAPESLRDVLLQGRDLVSKAPDVARLAGLGPTDDNKTQP